MYFCRSKAALANKKARFHCARLHLLCNRVMIISHKNLIINSLKKKGTNMATVFGVAEYDGVTIVALITGFLGTTTLAYMGNKTLKMRKL